MAGLMKNIARMSPTCRRYCRKWNSKMFMPAVMLAIYQRHVADNVAVVEQHYYNSIISTFLLYCILIKILLLVKRKEINFHNHIVNSAVLLQRHYRRNLANISPTLPLA